jgi:hypothetical protein
MSAGLGLQADPSRLQRSKSEEKRSSSAQVVEVPGAGHLHFGQDAAAVQVEVERFLNGGLGGGRLGGA